MKTVKITVELSAEPTRVFDVMTNNLVYTWRSDIARVDVVQSQTEFTEYTHTGKVTRFVIQESKRGQKYACSIYNKHFTGYFEAVLTPRIGGGTVLTMTENITFKRFIMRIIASLFWNLEKVQQTYVADLQAALGEGA